MTWDFPTAFPSWQYDDDGPESNAIDRVLASGRYTMGPETEAFEHELAEFHGRKYAVAVNSGSSANEVAALAARLHEYPDDPRHVGPLRMTVAMPALAWSTTYSPFFRLGYDFALLDADNTWNARLPTEADEEHGDWVIGCSILGNPAQLEELRRICDITGQTLIEDNCESIGALTPSGRLTGTFGHMSTFSFFYSHQLSAIEGGAILTDDPELAGLCRLLRNHGNAGWGRNDQERLYDFTVFGMNLRPTELHCAIAREQLRRLSDLTAARRANAAHFRSATYNLMIEHPREVGTPSPFCLPFAVDSQRTRLRLFAALRAAGIDARLPTGGSFTQHEYGKPWADQQTPNADAIHNTGLFIGNAPFPIPELIDRAVKVLRETL